MGEMCMKKGNRVCLKNVWYSDEGCCFSESMGVGECGEFSVRVLRTSPGGWNIGYRSDINKVSNYRMSLDNSVKLFYESKKDGVVFATTRQGDVLLEGNQFPVGTSVTLCVDRTHSTETLITLHVNRIERSSYTLPSIDFIPYIRLCGSVVLELL